MKNLKLTIMRPKGFHNNIEKIVKQASINVSKKSGWTKIKKCPACKSNINENWLLKNKILIKSCLKCGLGYSSMQPKNLEDVYNLKSEILNKKKTHKRRAKYFTKTFGKDRIKFIKKFKKKGSLLDFGCGTGEFANLAKSNFETSTFDYSKKMTEFVNKTYKIRSFNRLENIKTKFDIITMYDVIEHLKEPKKTLEILKDKLKKKGIIVIYTPNKNSLAFDYLKEKSNLCTTPFHLTYFTINSVKKMVNKNFKIIFSKTFGLDIIDILTFIRDRKYIKINNKDKNKILSIQNLIDKINYSNHLRVVLKKV